MGRLLDVSSRTVLRMEEGGRPPRGAAVAERLGDLAQIVELGELVYSPEGWRQFLTLPQPRFEGRTALQLIGCSTLKIFRARRFASVPLLAGESEG